MRILLTVLGALFGLLALSLSLFDVGDGLIENFPALEPYRNDFIWVVLVAALLWGCFGLYVLFVAIRDWIALRNSKLSGLGWDYCKYDELPKIQELADKNLPDPSPLPHTEKLYYHNKKCIRKILDNKNNNKVVGYVFLMPLTASGLKSIKNKNFNVNSDDLSIFRKSGLAKNCDYYVGALVGTNKLARAKAILIIKNFCAAQHVHRLFAKAATEDGLRLLRRQKFEPFSEEDSAELGVLFYRSAHMK